MTKEIVKLEEQGVAITADTAGLGMSKDEGSDRLSYIKVEQALSKDVEQFEIPAGSIVHGGTKQILAKKDQAFLFIPVFEYKDWSIWEGTGRTSKLVKRTFDPKGSWSDGSECIAEEFKWHGKTAPLAVEAFNFVVLGVPISDGGIPGILTFKKTDCKTGRLFKQFATGVMATEHAPIWGAVYSTKTKPTSNERGSWHIYENIRKERTTTPEERAFAFEVYTFIVNTGIENLIPTGQFSDDDIDVNTTQY